MARKARRLPPIHPGKILAEELDALEMSANALALALRIPANRVTGILSGKRGITVDTALRLAQYFGNSAQFWLNLQTAYELEVARQTALPTIKREVLPRRAA
jgi:addiction module HigA family antidote